MIIQMSNQKNWIMTEERFWYLVSKIGWGTKSTDYRQLGIELALYIKDEHEVKDLRSISNSMKDKLANVIFVFLARLDAKGETVSYHYWGGDDSFWDFKAHIVGLGKEFYDSVISNPVNMAKVGNNFKENFDYVFTHCEDYIKTPEGIKTINKNKRKNKLERVIYGKATTI